MHTTHRNPDRVVVEPAEREVVVSDSYVEEPSIVAPIARFLALAAAAFMTIVGLVAVVETDWGTAEWDIASADVLGMPFTPVVAIATAVLGLLAIGASVGYLGDGRIVMGAILACIGIVILVANGEPNELDLVDRHGWFTLGIGAVLLLAGLAAPGRMSRRTVRRDDALV